MNEAVKAGRKKKPQELKKKAHQVYATDDQWSAIEDMAQSRGLDVSPFIINTILK